MLTCNYRYCGSASLIKTTVHTLLRLVVSWSEEMFDGFKGPNFIDLSIHSISLKFLECWQEMAISAGRFVPKDMMTYDMVILRVPVEKLVGPA